MRSSQAAKEEQRRQYVADLAAQVRTVCRGDGRSSPQEPRKPSCALAHSGCKDKCQVWLMQQAQQRGVNRLMSTVWSAPAWMKSNNDYRGKTPSGELGYLLPSKQQAFADYLARYVSEYKSRFNVTITHVSPANEPRFPASYQGCLWSAKNLTSFIRDYLGPTFKKSEHPAVIVAPEDGGWAHREYTGAIVNDTAAAGRYGVGMYPQPHLCSSSPPTVSLTASLYIHSSHTHIQSSHTNILPLPLPLPLPHQHSPNNLQRTLACLPTTATTTLTSFPRR